MGAASVVGKRAVQTSFAVAGIVPVVAGLWGVFHPLAGSLGSELNHGRYLSGLLLAIGLVFWASIPDIERRTASIRVLTVVVVIGGVCRLLGVMMGDPLSLPVAGALAMELAVTPLLCFWQSRLMPRR
ncbi:DUF4345 domain-containing protein [Reyranella sp.]|jgi:hypothetical protein|uniref:DUF4345 domain-containing protein n=1 Tax=Reyranella sp. TaxID=1929291 RepID=UPI000BD80D42|nr:DUF4345 domain-containing protein [Reyranella sp.]OYY44698.1 MAG: hypothetical protein B7Y57_06105 [Rhodospirillales bacterium 35-66-84]OYZ95465.1 MAG: hypothetical protein B7Y08_09135 [Rhodospirillales bacterium 24-66-33]OZB26761.1 MAG: hypothetical protein B7X63_06455 [Rhodospirillales bacterium 39-66-50]HQS16221.1 DUF4345 domain-containing protein [Reyranella sp.]HQT11534.1 DUF4345 domain-containing protein [Reyranella sp.]